MKRPENQDHRTQQENRARMEKLAGSLMLLSFGLAMLAYLIAIDRPEWFSLRPVSGTAAAMSNASHAHPHDNASANRPSASHIARAHTGRHTGEAHDTN
ncbi:hypothetical protein LWE61_03085 [Sphingobium sufflavum]|uniref:hypothetical protein n=1 Tax=Sphingobium sufflavum TaxID=1129547 RepID=UPI001F1ED959|nr:hypothetical protein [Sphingobium sufflavum]MCE7795537.1 hypothetical protein [Sphingobium sufflavum]